MFMHLVAIEPAEQVAPDTEQQDTPNTVSQVPAPAPEPEEVTPTPAVPTPTPVRVESDAHREWARARDTFIAQHTQHDEFRQLSPEQRQILIATIGEEPPYAEEG